MQTLGAMSQALNRAPVYNGGLPARFDWPVTEGAGYSNACPELPRAVVAPRTLDIGEAPRRNRESLEKILPQSAPADSNGSPACFPANAFAKNYNPAHLMTKRLPLPRIFAASIAIGTAMLHLFSSAMAAEPLSQKELEFFESKVRPVLVEHCYGCHSAEAKAKGKLKAGLYVDSREGLVTGGETGPAVAPGKPLESLLIKVLKHEIKEAEMPPKGKLPEAVIADIMSWIAMGAPDPRAATAPAEKPKRVIDVNQGRQWWAFKRLAQPPVPKVTNSAWGRTPVDAFILAKQETAGLAPNPPAEKEKLLRRATFDLTGLAPTPEERQAFLRDDAPDAYRRLVDRLLDSPRYGERWARHWLDVVRYAESGGYEFDGYRPGAYHYRDWVVTAFNQDMPYDAFVRMQLAGDKLAPDEYDGTRAVGFLVAGPYPGQTTAKTLEKIRYDQLDDMVSTIGSGLLGITMACMRCHDHKFDPLPQRDYYGIAAALATTEQASKNLDLAPLETKKKLELYEKTDAELRGALRKFESEELPGRFARWRETSLAKLSSDAPWQILDIQSAQAQTTLLSADREGHVRYADKKAKDDVYTLKAVTYQKGIRSIRLDALSDAGLPSKGPGLSDNGNFVLSDLKIIARPLGAADKAEPVTLKLRPVKATFEQENYPLRFALDEDKSSGWAVAPQMGKDHAALFAIEGNPAGFENGTELEFQLRFTGHFGLGNLRVAFSNSPGDATLEDKEEMQIVREMKWLATVPEGSAASTNTPLQMRWFSYFDERARELAKAISDHQPKRPKPVMTEVYSTKDGGQDVYFLRRGEVDRKEGKAIPNFIQTLTRNGDASGKWMPSGSTHPRVALANWMTDAESGAGPLLARVIVNRLWRQHFGRGIVATPNDFGTQGTKPTHPELLDWLASELVGNGWKLKPIHRLIMLSAVYTQSGEINPANVQRDPDNLLWSQRPARRLEAESILDALLQCGGKLDSKMFGPAAENFESGRRGVYLRVKRSELIPFMTMFDAPEPSQSVGDRGGTTVPTQALASMNSGFVREQAGRLYDRVRETNPESAEAAIAKAYEIALCRLPSPSETARMKSFVDEQTEMLGRKPDSPAQAMREFCLALLCLNEFIYID